MNRAVILLSGGIDSTTLLYHVRDVIGVAEIRALSFVYGQKHSRELEMARWHTDRMDDVEHEVIDISFLKGLLGDSSALTSDSVDVPALGSLSRSQRDQPPTYVPNRNMIMLSLASAHAEAMGVTDVFYGAQAQDEYGYWDCTNEFLENVNRVLALNRRRPVCIHAPFLAQSKAEIVRIGLALGVDYARTWSCYRGKEKPCGECPTCVERASAFAGAGTADPLR